MYEVSDSASRLIISALRISGICWLALVLSEGLTAAPPPGAKFGKGTITISTQPAGAAIYVDGHPYGKAPAAVEGIGPGRYFVRAEFDGYRPSEAIVEMSSSQNSLSVSLELTSNSAPSRVEPAPPPSIPVAVPPPATPAPATPAPLRSATPIPVPVAPPRATPAPLPVAPPPSAEPAAGAETVITGRVAAHLKSITDGNVDAYLSLCAAKVDLYDEGMQSKDSIRRSRQKLKERWPVYEISNVRDLAVRDTDRPEVKRAAVTYDWNVSNPKTGKKASGTASDFLDFKQVGGEWLIVKARQNVDRKKSNTQ